MDSEPPNEQFAKKPGPGWVLWVSAAMFLSGLGFFLSATWPAAKSPQEQAPQLAIDTSAEAVDLPVLPVLEPAAHLEIARRNLKVGNVAEAYKSFQKLAAQTSDLPDESIRYEIAISAEGVGDARNASLLFEELANSAQAAIIRAGSVLGLARLRFRQRQYTAVDQIVAGGLNSGTLTVNESIRAEAEYLRAIALGRKACPEQSMPLLSAAGLMSGSVGWSVTRVLEMARGTVNKSGSERPTVIEAAGEGINAVLSVRLPQQNLMLTVNQVATACGLEPRWSAAARRDGESRTTTLGVKHLNAGSVFDRLLNQAGLAWAEKKSELMIVALTELPAAKRHRWHKNTARRALWDAVTAFPEDRQAALAMLSLGNLDAVEDPLSADARYQELLRQHRIPQIRMAALFNRGKIAFHGNQLEAAIDHFVAAAEFRNGTLPDVVALLYVGRLKLELGEATAAVNPLIRAIGHLKTTSYMTTDDQRTEHDDVLATAVQTLTLAWLARDNPLEANRSLMQYRPLLRLEPYRDATAFLTAIAAYRIAKTQDQKRDEGLTLIAALTHMQPELLFPQNGIALVGEAWRDLGLTAQMEMLYRTRLNTVKSDWLRKRMLLDLVQYHRVVGEEQRVEELLGLLGVFSDPADTQIRVAQVESARAGRDARESLAACRELLNEPGIDQSAVLQVMGRVFESDGDFRAAANCFGGMLPPTPAQVEETP